MVNKETQSNLIDRQFFLNSAVIVFAVIAFFNLILPQKIGLSMFAGSVIGVINLCMLGMTLEKGVAVKKERIKRFVAGRYILRFCFTAFVISILISQDLVSPFPFIIGFTIGMTGMSIIFARKGL